MNRRGFMQSATVLAAAAAQASPQAEEGDRAYWLPILEKLAGPVLRNLAAETLKQKMPVECVTGNPSERRKYTHLEALGRLLAGIAPWLEATLDPGPERYPAALPRTGARWDRQSRRSEIAGL